MYRIAVLGGDGIGPEVAREGLKVLKVTSELVGFEYETTDYPFGSEHYLKTGELVPESIYDEYREHDRYPTKSASRLVGSSVRRQN